MTVKKNDQFVSFLFDMLLKNSNYNLGSFESLPYLPCVSVISLKYFVLKDWFYVLERC